MKGGMVSFSGHTYYIYGYVNSYVTVIQYIEMPGRTPYSYCTRLTIDNWDEVTKLDKPIPKCIQDCLSVMLGASGICSGADPEIFIGKGEGIIPAFDFLPSKKEPLKGYSSSNNSGQNIYWDGFQAEFTVLANGCLGWVTDSVQSTMKKLLEVAKKHDKDAVLLPKPTVYVSKEALAAGKDEHVEFGCTPSLNAYGIPGAFIPGRVCEIRSSGGHIHFGLGKLSEDVANLIVKRLDAIVGVLSVSLFQSFDDRNRRMMYGLAGEYRLPEHGLEYRTLSNAWVYHPVAMNFIFNMARAIAASFLANDILPWEATEIEVVQCINTCDVALAQEILMRNDATLRKIIDQVYPMYPTGHVEVAMEMIYNGIETVIPHYTAIEKNWELESDWTGHCDGIEKNWKTFSAAAVTRKVKAA